MSAGRLSINDTDDTDDSEETTANSGARYDILNVNSRRAKTPNHVRNFSCIADI